MSISKNDDDYNEREIKNLLRFEDDQLTPEILKIARDELGETVELRSKSLQTLKNIIQNFKDLNPRTDDEFLIRFLRTSKFDPTKAFLRLRKYYEQKRKYPEIFQKMCPKDCSNIMQAKLHGFLPYRNSDGSAICVARRGHWDPSKVTIDEFMRFDNLCMEVLIANPITQVCGVTVILDASGLTLSQLATITPSKAYCFITTIQDAFPGRFRAIHIVNAPRIFSLFYRLCQPFLSEKFLKRLVMHSSSESWDSLHRYISPSLLPEEYGGYMGPLDYSKTHDLINGMEDVLKSHLNSLFPTTT